MSRHARVTSLALISTVLALVAGPVAAASAAGRQGQVDRDGLHVRRQQPRGLHRQGPRAGARRARLARRTSRSRRSPTAVRATTRAAATGRPPSCTTRPRACSRMPRAPSPTGASATWATPDTLADFVDVVEDELPGRSLRPVLLGPRLGLAPRLDDGGRIVRAGDGLNPDEVKSCPAAARLHRRRRLRRLQHGPDRDHVAVERPRDGARRARRSS